MNSPRQNGTFSISATVLDCFRQHCREELHYTDIETATGFSNPQVMSAIAHLRKQGRSIVSPLKGWYVYDGDDCTTNGVAPVTARSTAKIIDVLADGRPLLTIDGRLFVAAELDIQV